MLFNHSESCWAAGGHLPYLGAPFKKEDTAAKRTSQRHWRGRQEKAQAFRLGAHQGLFCLRCCWSLMLLMFAVGIGNVGWRLPLVAIMGVEKIMPWGRKVSAPLGAFLLGWSLALLYFA